MMITRNNNINNHNQDKRYDVKKYTVSELLKMIGIKDGEEKELNENSIKTKCNHLINSFSKSKTKIDIKNIPIYKNFILNVQNELVENIKNKLIGNNAKEYKDSMNDFIPKDNQPVKTYNTKFPKSLINPVYKETITQLVSIDSIFRERTDDSNSINYYQTSSNFQYKLANPLKNVISMKISTVEMPFVWYLFNQSNNTFTIETKNNPDGITEDTLHVITIPVGSYTNPTLISFINNIFINTGKGLEYIIFGIEEATGKSFFRVKKQGYDDEVTAVNDPYKDDPNPENPFIFNIYFYKDFKKICEQKSLNEYDSLGWLLGFRQPTYFVTKNDIYIDYYTFDSTYELPNYLKSEGAYGTSATNYIFIDVDDFNNNFKSSGIIADNNDYISSSTILGRIGIMVPANTMLFNTASDKVFKTREYFGPISITRLNFKLLDRFGNVINLQNNDWSISLEFTVIYQ